MSDSTQPDVFRDAADRYDALVDWPRRLANEEPFFRRRFAEAGVRRVLDAACGLGYHASMFHSWGLEVEGADISRAMIERCRQKHGEPSGLRWAVRSFDQPHPDGAAFDAVICTGNSLSLAADLNAARSALVAMAGGLRSGGLLIVHVLNLQRLQEGPVVWQKCKRVRIGGEDRILIKGVHRLGGRGIMEFAELTLGDQGVSAQFRSHELLWLDAPTLTAGCQQAGLNDVRLFGDYQDAVFEPMSSVDLILVARRGLPLR